MSLAAQPDLTIPMKDFRPEMGGVRNQLDPIGLSDEEQEFLLEHLEDSPAMALKGWDPAIPHNPTDGVPGLNPQPVPEQCNPWCLEHPGVNPRDMRALLARIREVEEVYPEAFGYYRRDSALAPLIGREPNEEFWGLGAIRASVKDAQEYNRRLRALRERDPSAGLHPSMNVVDSRGRLHPQGPGTDQGSVRRFTCWIQHEETGKVDPEWAAAAVSEAVTSEESEKAEGPGAEYVLIEGENFLECPVQGCNHREKFDPEDHRSKNLARGRMSKHMNQDKKSPDDHREARMVIFG